MLNPQVSFVIPLFNESETFSQLIERLDKLCNSLPVTVEIVLVDDGSNDNTSEMMFSLGLINERYQCVFLSRNYGHQVALSAGLKYARATEALMILDGDLQDPPELFLEFYNEFKAGYDVVYAIRKRRKEGLFKRMAYYSFYRILKRISNIDLPIDSGDFSLISRRVVDVINKMPEESRYIRGMRTWVGFRQTGVKYEREERFAGSSKYSLNMLFKLAYNGIFNFSEVPIKFITNLGIASILISLGYLIQSIYKRIVYPDFPVGFTGLLFAIILFGGVQLVSLGIIGEYVLRIFFQVKGRPLYVVRNLIRDKEDLKK